MQRAIKPKLISGKSILLLVSAVAFSLIILEVVCRMFLQKELPANKPRIFIANNEAYSWCQPKKLSRKVINKKSGGGEFVMLMPNLFFAHEYLAFQTHQRRGGGCRYPMLPGACFGDDPRFTHFFGQQDLSQNIIDLMRPGMIEVFPFEIDLGPAQVAGHLFSIIEQRRPARIALHERI